MIVIELAPIILARGWKLRSSRVRYTFENVRPPLILERGQKRFNVFKLTTAIG